MTTDPVEVLCIHVGRKTILIKCLPSVHSAPACAMYTQQFFLDSHHLLVAYEPVRPKIKTVETYTHVQTL